MGPQKHFDRKETLPSPFLSWVAGLCARIPLAILRWGEFQEIAYGSDKLFRLICMNPVSSIGNVLNLCLREESFNLRVVI